MGKENITNEQLAAMIKKGFDDVDKKFIKSFSGIEERLDKIEMRLDNVVYRFEYNELKQKYLILNKRIEALERKA